MAAMIRPHKAIALESRLRHCRNVRTLGVHPNFCDYSPADAALIRGAAKIYYPTRLYAPLLTAAGKAIFPSVHNYACAQDKIKQTALFKLLGIPHPRTRVFYGRRSKKTIADHFAYPFVAKIPRGSAMGRGVFLITDAAALTSYLDLGTPAYIQEFFPFERDMRVVVVGRRVVHAYWRVVPPGDFRSNVAQGAAICLDPVPQAALALARKTAARCGWNDVGIDICRHDNRYWVLEANMKYGRQGFSAAGLNYTAIMENLIEEGVI